MTDPSIRAHRKASLVMIAAAALTAGAAHAQSYYIYSNDSTTPDSPALGAVDVANDGTPAPFGGSWSEVPNLDANEANAIAGFSTHSTGLTGAYRFADDFIVPGPDSWRLQTASFYAYQTDSLPGASPFSAVNVRIWRGVPGAPGSIVVFGDTTTNRLVYSLPTTIYRIFNTATNPSQPATPSRLIRRTNADLAGITLPPGAYWIDWQYVLADPLLQAFSPPVTVPGSRGPTAANAMQFRPDGEGVWTAVTDPGKPSLAPDVPQDLPFILQGRLVCAADFNRDDTVNSQDFFDYLAAFFASDPAADFNLDSVVNSQDLFDFLTAFFSCA